MKEIHFDIESKIKKMTEEMESKIGQINNEIKKQR